MKTARHAIRHLVLDEFINTPHVGSSHQLMGNLTKGLSTTFHDSIFFASWAYLIFTFQLEGECEYI